MGGGGGRGGGGGFGGGGFGAAVSPEVGSVVDTGAGSAADLSEVDIAAASRAPGSAACAGLAVCVPDGVQVAGASEVAGPEEGAGVGAVAGATVGAGAWPLRASGSRPAPTMAAIPYGYGYDPYGYGGYGYAGYDDGCVPVARRVFDGYGYRISYVYSCGAYY